MASLCRSRKAPTRIDRAQRRQLTARRLGLMGLLGALVMASEAGAGGLFPSRTFAVGDSTWSVAVADFDGDSVPDLVTANRDSADVSGLLGIGDGSFQAAVGFGAGSSPVSVAVADLDGDSVPDLVTANNGSSDVSVLLNQCDPPALSVDLDIKPGSDRNAINPSSRGVRGDPRIRIFRRRGHRRNDTCSRIRRSAHCTRRG